MPRTHGRIWAAIWNDPDFTALDESAQRLYMFLISQGDLSHAGLVPMRIRRWASKTHGISPKQLENTLDYLHERAFIVADYDTEEVLIRTFVRNDQVYKQPKVMVRLREDARQIESPELRRAFRAELTRLPLAELSTNGTGPHGDGPSTRESVQGVVDALLGDFADTSDNPPPGVSDTHTDTPRVRAGGFSQPPTPSPLPPTPSHQPPDKPSPDKSGQTQPPDRFDEFWDTYGKKVDRKTAERRWRDALKKPGVTADLLVAAAAAYVLAERENQGGRFVMDPSKWLLNERWRDERPARAAPKTRVQEHLALVQSLGPQPPASPFQIGPA